MKIREFRFIKYRILGNNVEILSYYLEEFINDGIRDN